MSPDPYKRDVPYVPPVRGYEQQLELQLNKTREATPEECAQWEQEDFFRAGKFDSMKMFVVLPTLIQLIMMAFMFSVFWFNANNF
tara:strand:- start:366 stop:620 length:255 start_codon:yes stop_codon:yes gene_type:complete